FKYWDRTGIFDSENIAEKFDITAFPNPFFKRCRIEINVGGKYKIDDMNIPIEISTLDGRIVEKSELKSINRYFIWKPDNLNNGIYIVRIRLGEKLYSKRLIFIK
ncbi:hypothetical protein DRQ33_06240, partial [bacterium]